MTHNRTNLIRHKAAAKIEAERTNHAAHEEMIPVMGPDGRWHLVPGDLNSGDIFANPFSTFTEWDSEEDREGFKKL